MSVEVLDCEDYGGDMCDAPVETNEIGETACNEFDCKTCINEYGYHVFFETASCPGSEPLVYTLKLTCCDLPGMMS